MQRADLVSLNLDLVNKASESFSSAHAYAAIEIIHRDICQPKRSATDREAAYLLLCGIGFNVYNQEPLVAARALAAALSIAPGEILLPRVERILKLAALREPQIVAHLLLPVVEKYTQTRIGDAASVGLLEAAGVEIGAVEKSRRDEAKFWVTFVRRNSRSPKIRILCADLLAHESEISGKGHSNHTHVRGR